MTSSRRSARPAHNLLQSSKKQPQSSKNSTPASVSFIFAEPEQGSPLHSASRVIASTHPDTFSIHSTDNTSIYSRRITSKPSISSLRTFGSPVQELDETQQSVLPERRLDEDRSSLPRDTEAIEVVEPTALNVTPTAGPVSPSFSSPDPTFHPRSTSWFGNFGRARSVTTNVVNTTLPSENVTLSGVTTEVHENRSTASLPTRISVIATDERGKSLSRLPALSSSLPKTLDQSAVSPSPTASCDISKQLDDTVLQLSPVSTPPPPSTLPHTALNYYSGEPLVLPPESSSLHEEVPVIDLSATLPPISTQGRFAMSIPLFGRPRVPLAAGPEKVGGENSNRGHSVTQNAEPMDIDSSSIPPATIDSLTNSAQGPLQNAIVHPSELPSIDDARMDISQGTNNESSLPQLSADLADPDPQVMVDPAKGFWWTYIGWNSSPVPPGPVSSTFPENSVSVSPSPGSALRQDDSVAAAVPPLSITPTVTSEPRDSSSSPKMTTPSKGSPIIQALHGRHANEADEGTDSQGANTSGGDVEKGTERSEPEALVPSLESPDHSEQVSQSADQSIQGVTQTPSATSWFSPWSWYSHSTTQGTRSAPADEGNRHVDKETVDSCDPTGKQAIRERDSIGYDPGVGTASGKHGGVEDDESKALGFGAPLGEGLETANTAMEATGHQPLDPEPEITSSSHEVANPIEESITTYRSGWASFFSSRTLVVKRLGYTGSVVSGDVEAVDRDENGMEIMDVDSDEDAKSADETTKSDHDHGRKLDTDGAVKSKAAGNKRKSEKPAAPRSSTPLDNTKPIWKQDAISLQQSQPTAQSATVSDDAQLNLQSGSAAPKVQSSPGPTNLISMPSISSGQGVPDPSVSSVPAVVTGDTRGVKRTASPVPSSSKKVHSPPNLVLPTWKNTFYVPPRSIIPPSPEIKQQDHERSGGKFLGRAMGFVSGVLFSKDGTATGGASGNKGQLSSGTSGEHRGHISMLEKEQREKYQNFGKQLPRAWDLVGPTQDVSRTSRTSVSQTPTEVAKKAVGRFLTDIQDVNQHGTFSSGEQTDINDTLRGCRRVVVIGVHGWFPGAVVRTVLGEPTGTSDKFVNMMVQALENFQRDYEVSLEKITRIPLEGEGTIERRVEKLYHNLTANQEWINDLHSADAIFVATHSQGSVVSTHLLNCLIRDGHICTSTDGLGPGTLVSKLQRACCLSLCGIHLGPLRYLSSSTFFQPYIQYFESVAARELFEFQNTESAVSKSYVNALRRVLNSGVKMVYVASLNDQVVPIYSGLFTAVSHPLILRALYIDGAAYHSSDFLSNLLVLLLRILNSGISDSGLLAHLSEATAGSLSGVGHSTAYEEIATYSLAVKYLFLTDHGHADQPEVNLEPFNASHEQNDYEIPWALRDVIANEHVAHFFAQEVAELRDAFRDWHPKTTILRDLKRKLQPIQRLPQTFSSQNSASKL